MLTQFGVSIHTGRAAELDRRRDGSGHLRAARCSKYEEKEDLVGPELMRETERMIMLNVIDNQWKDHLLSMDHLKEGIGLRGYGQKDPLVEYKKESYILFQDMMDRIEDETIRWLFFMQRSETAAAGPDVPHPECGTTSRRRGRRRRRAGAVAVAARPQRAAAGRAELGAGPDAQHPAQEGKGAGRAAIRRRRDDRRASSR